MPDKKWREAASRLAHMDRRELLERSRQELAKRSDAVLSRFGFDFVRGLVQRANTTSGQFFFAASSIPTILELLRQRLPQQAEEIVLRADKICRHQFDLLGYEDLEYGNPIDWHLDVVHGKRAPKKMSYRIPYLDFGQVGDCKITWELNRHQHWVTLAKAYRLTEEQRYAEEILQQWRHWHADNPYPVGINWSSSLEVSFRSLSWIWMYQLLDGTPALPIEFHKEWLRAQALNGRHIERYLSTYFSPNTHLLGEAVALMFLGTLCPEISCAARWKSRGWEIVLQEARRQVREDGVHFEQSTYYHVYAVDFFLHAAVLASLNQIAIPTEFEGTLEKMLDALYLLGRAGSPPHFGDDDGGRLFDPRRNRGEHYSDPLATGAVLFNRGEFKAAVGELREETIWLLGEQGITEWDRLQPQPSEFASAALRSAGFYMLSASSPQSQMVINAGSQNDGNAGHAHADALSVCLQSEGHELLVDPGTFAYASDGGERDLFRATAMHNTLRVDGMSQSEPEGSFGWKQLACARTERWITGESFSLFVASHDGYSRLASPAIHRRWVVSLKSGLFLVRDLVCGTGEHQLDVSWHLGPEMQLRADNLFAVKGTSNGLAILCAEKHGWSQEVRKDVWSPVYGMKQPITVLNFGTRVALPAEFVTLFIPLQEARSIPGKLWSPSEEPASPVKAYRYSTPSENCSFFFAEKGRTWTHSGLVSDAEFVCRQKSRQEQDELLIFCNGSYVEIEGRRVLSGEQRVARCEILTRDGDIKMFSSDPLPDEQLTRSKEKLNR